MGMTLKELLTKGEGTLSAQEAKALAAQCRMDLDTLVDIDLLRSERDRQLYDALEKLKAEYREALYLVYFEDMSYRDAATVMNKSESQITKLVYRGKQSLKVILEQEGFTYADKCRFLKKNGSFCF